jgi:predicted dehydrogenase
MDNYKPKMVVGTKYKKLRIPTAGTLGSVDTNQHTVEDAAFGFIVMENGAPITLDATWALNTSTPVNEGSVGAVRRQGRAEIMPGGVCINKVEFGKAARNPPQYGGGRRGLFRRREGNAQITEARRWIQCIQNDTDPIVLPEQAASSPKFWRPSMNRKDRPARLLRKVGSLKTFFQTGSFGLSRQNTARI